MKQHNWLILALQYLLITSGCISLSKWSEELFRSANSHVQRVAATKMVLWLSLLPLPPKHAMCCTVTVWVSLELWDTSLIWWLPLQEYINFFFPMNSDMQLSSCEEEDGASPRGRGLRRWRHLDLLHWVVMSFWISCYTTHVIGRVPKAPYCGTTQ